MRDSPWRPVAWAIWLGVLVVSAVPLVPAAQRPISAGADWGAPGGDWASTRYSTLSNINTTNVARLGGAWVVDLPEGVVSKAPLMVQDGRMFVPTSQGTILALDPATGRSLWTYTPETPFSGNRGVGIGEGLLFAGLRNSNVVAINQQTGAVAWTYEHGPEIPSQGMSSAPAYGNGVVVAVVSLGDNFLRGRAIGLDAKTGKFLWKFEVVPGPVTQFDSIDSIDATDDTVLASASLDDPVDDSPDDAVVDDSLDDSVDAPDESVDSPDDSVDADDDSDSLDSVDSSD